ncbi:MAG: helix-turn-helix transcriptional regulator [Actinomycetia bacterium]|nr:helix-turn-helix transcriptional regulator [Actinomycetes bacterium]
MAKSITPQARDAARALGAQVTAARRRRRWSATRLAEQAGISAPTLRKVERGDPSVALGTALDVAAMVGVPLFSSSPTELAVLAVLADSLIDRAALLGERVVPISDVGLDDDF